jgi:hypothetical protein
MLDRIGIFSGIFPLAAKVPFCGERVARRPEMACKKTSPKVAKTAGKLLGASNTPKAVKRVAGSALSQRQKRK